jgi:hypothetical protein
MIMLLCSINYEAKFLVIISILAASDFGPKVEAQGTPLGSSVFAAQVYDNIFYAQAARYYADSNAAWD